MRHVKEETSGYCESQQGINWSWREMVVELVGPNAFVDMDSDETLVDGVDKNEQYQSYYDY